MDFFRSYSLKNGLLQFDNTQASFTGSEPAQQNLSLVSREDIDSSSDAGQSSTYKAQQLEVINTNTDQSISSKILQIALFSGQINGIMIRYF